MATKNYSGTTQNMQVQYLTANQAWTVLWHGNPISIRDRLFWEDLRALSANLDDMGLDVQQDGTILRWCPVGRLLPGYPAYLAFLAVCPNHADDASPFCAEHLAHG